MTPPPFAERLLSAAIDPSWRDSIAGDLREEYGARPGGLRTNLWYWLEAARLAVRFGIPRLLRRRTSHNQERFVTSLLSDLKYALRNVIRQPGYSLIVALTLALGLGLNAAVFGMIDALLLRPFQFRDYQRIVVLWETSRGGSQVENVSPANYLDWRRQTKSVEQLTAWEWWDATLTGREEPERLQGFRVSPGFFELLGIAPALGRTFTEDESRPGNDRSIVIGDGLWKRRFGADPGVIGRDILVDGERYGVVGIAPAGFEFPLGSEMWAPLAFTPRRAFEREARFLTVGGKLADGRSPYDAQAEMTLIARGLERQYPEVNRGRGVAVRTLSNAFREGNAVPTVATLQAGAGLVLLVACANIAGLLLARAVDRKRELALRTALGASRARIVRQLVTETIVLGLLASVVAILFARAGLDVLRSSMPAETARFIEGWNNLRLDPRVIILIPALAIAVGLLVGLFPAIATTRKSLTEALKEGDRRAAGGLRRQRGRQALVVAQIAFALALLIAAGLTVTGGIRLVNKPGGFDAQRLLTFQISFPEARYHDPAVRREFAANLLARVESTAGIERAGIANVLPASGWSPAIGFMVEHQPVTDPARTPRAGYRAVSARFFEAMRIPILRGRAFDGPDREDTQPVAIVSASLAARYWPGQEAIGRRLRFDLPGREEWLNVIGVVGDVSMFNWWDGEDAAAVYRPLRQAPPDGNIQAVVRTRGEPGSASAAVRQAVHAIDPLLSVHRFRSMQQAIEDSSTGLTYLATLMGICGAIALALSVLGIYSVMAYTMSQRTHEFGVRMALGATAPDVLVLTLKQAGALTATGVLVGSLIAVVLGKLMSSALFGVVSLEPVTFLAAGPGLALVSLAAAYVPARRALRLDPASILRSE